MIQQFKSLVVFCPGTYLKDFDHSARVTLSCSFHHMLTEDLETTNLNQEILKNNISSYTFINLTPYTDSYCASLNL